MQTSSNQYSFHNLCQSVLKTYFRKKYEIDITQIYPYFFANNKLPNNVLGLKDKNEIFSWIEKSCLKDMKENEVKDQGVYFTHNKELIDHILASILITPTDNKIILEPAAGSGNFVVAFIKKIITNFVGVQNREVLTTIASSIVSVEINHVLCIAIEAKMILSCDKLFDGAFKEDTTFVSPKFCIVNEDFLKFSEKADTKFDYIVGNPPYVTMYGRRSRTMTEEKRKYFNNNFDFVINKNGNNKFNLSMFFIDRGINLLKENGVLLYLLDIAFFETPYKDIRKYILENTKIINIELLESQFDNVISGQFIIKLIRTSCFADCQENTVFWHYLGEIYRQKQYVIYNEKNEYKFSLPLKTAEKIFVANLDKHKCLLDLFPRKSLRTCCALTGKTDDFIICKDIEKDDGIVPYLEGASGVFARYCKPFASKHIKLDYDLQIKLSNEFKEELAKKGVKNKKRVTLGDIEGYYFPKIFIRQSAKEIVATYTEKPFAANNSLYIFTLKSNLEKDKKLLKYLLAVFNSEIISLYAQKTGIIRTGKGKTPQMKLSDLKKIPIVVDNEQIDHVADIVTALLESENQRESQQYLLQLNSIINEIYQVDRKLIQSI